MMDSIITFRRRVVHLHALGPRALAEFVEAIAQQVDCAEAVLDLLAEYERRLTPELIRAAGADTFPRRVPMLVRG